MSNVMLVYWGQRIMINVAIKIANFVKIKELFAVIKIHLAVKIVSLCRLE
jgi:hypothetical protein